MGHIGSKTRSLGQILEKSSVRCRGHILSLIVMKLCHNVCLDKKSRTSTKMGHVRSKTRSLGEILEKPCVCTKGNIFSLIVMKLVQNVYLDEISDEFEKGSCQAKNRSLHQLFEKKNLVCALEARFLV